MYQIINKNTNEVEQEVEWLNEVNDGNHTMVDLYNHRALLFAVICRAYKDKAHLTFKHSNRSMPEGKFYVWIDTPKGIYGYHYTLDKLSLFSGIKEEPIDNVYDGYTDKDIDRLLSLVSEE